VGGDLSPPTHRDVVLDVVEGRRVWHNVPVTIPSDSASDPSSLRSRLVPSRNRPRRPRHVEPSMTARLIGDTPTQQFRRCQPSQQPRADSPVAMADEGRREWRSMRRRLSLRLPWSLWPRAASAQQPRRRADADRGLASLALSPVASPVAFLEIHDVSDDGAAAWVTLEFVTSTSEVVQVP
jgi:hypothetical protein